MSVTYKGVTYNNLTLDQVMKLDNYQSAMKMIDLAAMIDLALGKVAVAVDLSGSAPTAAQMVAAFGTAVANSGKVFVMSDSSDATKSYECFSDGVNWFQKVGTKGV